MEAPTREIRRHFLGVAVATPQVQNAMTRRSGALRGTSLGDRTRRTGPLHLPAFDVNDESKYRTKPAAHSISW